MTRFLAGLINGSRQNGALAMLRSVLASIAQVILQNSPVSGAIFLLSIAANSIDQAVTVLAGALAGVISAKACEFPLADIKQGMFGFNGVLIGIALNIHFGFNSSTIFLTIVCSAASVVVGSLLTKLLRMPYYTMPFVLLTWSAMATFPIHHAVSDGVKMGSDLDLVTATLNGIGQVLLQSGTLSGVLIVAGLAFASPFAAVLAVIVSGMSAVCGSALGLPAVVVNEGLTGYNLVLVALAMKATGRRGGTILVACVLAYIFAWIFLMLRLPPFTAPFVLSVWLIQFLTRRLTRQNIKTCTSPTELP